MHNIILCILGVQIINDAHELRSLIKVIFHDFILKGCRYVGRQYLEGVEDVGVMGCGTRDRLNILNINFGILGHRSPSLVLSALFCSRCGCKAKVITNFGVILHSLIHEIDEHIANHR